MNSDSIYCYLVSYQMAGYGDRVFTMTIASTAVLLEPQTWGLVSEALSHEYLPSVSIVGIKLINQAVPVLMDGVEVA